MQLVAQQPSTILELRDAVGTAEEGGAVNGQQRYSCWWALDCILRSACQSCVFVVQLGS